MEPPDLADGALTIAIGARCLSTEDHAQAREHFTRALTLAIRSSNRELAGQALHGLGGAAALAGEPRLALEFFEQALAIVRELGDRSGEADVVNSINALREETHAAAGSRARELDAYPGLENKLLELYLKQERARGSGHRYRDPSPRMALRCLMCPTDFFISYRTIHAREYCEMLRSELVSRGLSVALVPSGAAESRVEGQSDDEYRTVVEQRLAPQISASKIFLMVAAGEYLRSEWTKWETTVFEEGPNGRGREGKMLTLLTPASDPTDATLFFLKIATDGLPIMEMRSSWEHGQPSRLVADALEYHLRRFRRELRLQLILWLLPSPLRKRLFPEIELDPKWPSHWVDIEGRVRAAKSSSAGARSTNDEDLHERVSLLRQQASTLLATRDSRCVALYRSALSVAMQSGDKDLQGRVAFELGFAHAQLQQLAEAEAVLNDVQNFSSDSLLHAEALIMLGRIAWSRFEMLVMTRPSDDPGFLSEEGRKLYENAERFGEHAVRIMPEGAIELRLKGHGHLAHLYRTVAKFDQAIIHFQACLQLDQARGNSMGEALIRRNLAEQLFYAGRPEQAREHLTAAIDIFDSLGESYKEAASEARELRARVERASA